MCLLLEFSLSKMPATSDTSKKISPLFDYSYSPSSHSRAHHNLALPKPSPTPLRGYHSTACALLFYDPRTDSSLTLFIFVVEAELACQLEGILVPPGFLHRDDHSQNHSPPHRCRRQGLDASRGSVEGEAPSLHQVRAKIRAKN